MKSKNLSSRSVGQLILKILIAPIVVGILSGIALPSDGIQTPEKRTPAQQAAKNQTDDVKKVTDKAKTDSPAKKLVTPAINPETKDKNKNETTDDQEKDDDEESTSRQFARADDVTFISAPRELIRPLMRARRAIAENEPNRAAELIGQFLIESPSVDYLIASDPTRKSMSSVSLRQTAEAMLAKLPDSAIESYRLRYGVPARHQLEQAIANNDTAKFGEIAMRYFFTEAGQKATLILGHHELDHGNSISAAACFQKVLKLSPSPNKFEPELSILLATSQSLAGDNESAQKTLESLRDFQGRNPIIFQGSKTPLFRSNEDSITWLTNLIGNTEFSKSPRVNQWLMEGGNAKRNARVGQGLPFQKPLWSVDLYESNDSPSSDNFRGFNRQLQGKTNLPTHNVYAAGGTILYSSAGQTFGVDFQSGKRKWVYPSNDSPPPENLNLNQLSNGFNNRSYGLQNSQANRTAFAASDGSHLYVVPFQRPQVQLNVYPPVAQKAPPNQLVAVDLAAQGRLLWSIGTTKPDPDSAINEEVADPKNENIDINKARFLGAPLPVGDELYVICSLQQSNQLLVLDRATGQLKWRQHLAENETPRPSSSRFSLGQGANLTPSYANGLIVCPTGTGAVVAIDVATRTFLWGHQYDLTKRSSSIPNGINKNANLVIDGNRVTFSSPEANRLLCLDIETGKPLSTFGSTGISLAGSLYLACVENDHAIVVSQSSVQAVELATRKTAWTCAIGDYGQPSGRGFAADGFYFLPTTDNYLLKIDLAKGKIVESVPTDTTLGNLIAYQGTVISIDAKNLACFETDITAARNLEQALAQVKTPEELPSKFQIQRSRLLAREKKWAEALKALDLAKADPLIENHERVGLLQQMLENDIVASKDVVEKYWPRLSPLNRERLSPSLVDYLIRGSYHAEAAARLIEWSNRQTNLGLFVQPMEQTSELPDDFSVEQRVRAFDRATVKAEAFVISDRERVRLSKVQWFRSKLQSIVDQSPESTMSIQAIVKKQLDARPNESAKERHQFLLRYPSRIVPQQTKLQLARDLMAAKEWIRAKHTILAVIGFDPADVALIGNHTALAIPETGSENMELWFEYSLRRSYLDSAKHVLSAIKASNLRIMDLERNDLPVWLGKMDSLLAEASVAIAENSSRRRPAKPPSHDAWANLNSATASSTTSSRFNTNLAVQVFHDDTRFSRIAEYTISALSSTRELEFFDETGASLNKISLSPQFSNNSRDDARIDHDDSLLLLRRGNRLAAIDLDKALAGANDAMIWNHSVQVFTDQVQRAKLQLSGEMPLRRNTNNIRTAVANVSLNGICLIDKLHLICLDPFTGQVRWKRPVKTSISTLFGDDKHVILVDHRGRTAEVYEIATARRTKIISLPERFAAVWDNVGTRAVSVSSIKESRLKELDNGSEEVMGGKGLTNIVYSNKKGSRTFVGLFDFLEEKYIWEKRLLYDTKATRLSRRRLAVVPATGNLKIFDLQTGQKLKQVVLNWQPDQLRRVDRVGAVRFGKHDLIVFNRNKATLPSLSGGNLVSMQKLLSSEVLIDGSMMLLDGKTMAPKWRNRINMTGFGMVQFIPTSSPLLFFHRRLKSSNSMINRMVPSQHLVGVNANDGQLIVSHLHPFASSVQYSGAMRFDANDGSYELDFGRARVKLAAFRDDELPPTPVTSFSRSNPMPTVRPASINDSLKPELIVASIKVRRAAALKNERDLKRLRELERQKLKSEFGGNK